MRNPATLAVEGNKRLLTAFENGEYQVKGDGDFFAAAHDD